MVDLSNKFVLSLDTPNEGEKFPAGSSLIGIQIGQHKSLEVWAILHAKELYGHPSLGIGVAVSLPLFKPSDAKFLATKCVSFSF
jgi:hypothetical protein